MNFSNIHSTSLDITHGATQSMVYGNKMVRIIPSQLISFQMLELFFYLLNFIHAWAILYHYSLVSLSNFRFLQKSFTVKNPFQSVPRLTSMLITDKCLACSLDCPGLLCRSLRTHGAFIPLICKSVFMSFAH